MAKLKTIIPLLVSVLCSNHLAAATESKDRFPDAVQPSVITIQRLDSLGNPYHWGTGFLWFNNEDKCNVLITNRHVLEPLDENGNKIQLKEVYVKTNITEELKEPLKLQKNAWGVFRIPLRDSNVIYWTGHPNPNIDIAAMYFPPLDSLHRKLLKISNALFIPKSLRLAFDSLELADQVLFFGFPLGLGTESNPRTFIRYGMIANIDFENKSFYLDAQVFAGSSGSPVVHTGLSLGDIGNSQRSRKLIGIIVGFKPVQLKKIIMNGKINQVTSDTIAVENSGLAWVHSTDLIEETVLAHSERFRCYCHNALMKKNDE